MDKNIDNILLSFDGILVCCMVAILKLTSGDCCEMSNTYRILMILVPIESFQKAIQNDTKFITIHKLSKILLFGTKYSIILYVATNILEIARIPIDVRA